MSATTNDSVVELMNENTRLLARVAELEFALTPFALTWGLGVQTGTDRLWPHAFEHAAQVLRKAVPNAHV